MRINTIAPIMAMSLHAKLGRDGESVLLNERTVGEDIARIVRRECPVSRVRVGGTILNVGSDEMSVNYICDCRGKEFVACVEYRLVPVDGEAHLLPAVEAFSVRQGDKPCFGVSGYKRFERYAKRLELEVEFSGSEG